jgi:hypothetical protein
MSTLGGRPFPRLATAAAVPDPAPAAAAADPDPAPDPDPGAASAARGGAIDRNAAAPVTTTIPSGAPFRAMRATSSRVDRLTAAITRRPAAITREGLM